MQRLFEHLPFDRIVPVSVAATIFAFACGSSSVGPVNDVGKTLRWGMLLVLFGLTAAWTIGRRERPSLHPAVAAAVVAFLGLAAVSSLWSVDARLSIARAGALAIVLATAALLASAREPQQVLAGVVAAAVAVAIAGLVMLAIDHSNAVVPASIEVPARFRGFGENPNTAPLLLALGVPIALAAVLSARTAFVRAAGACALVVLAGSIVASGSRGGLAGAAAGALVPAVACPRTRRGRVLAVTAVVVALAGGAFSSSIPKPLPIQTSRPTAARTPPVERPRYVNVERAYPLDMDLGRPLPGGGEPPVRRSFFGTSGRTQAWGGAIRLAAARPIAGYGFGTEGKVFVDRYYRFAGGLTENSYIGIGLQLGIVGLIALGGLLAALVLAGHSALGGAGRHAAIATLGVIVAGAVLATVQSYLYSPGNLATLAFWSAGLLPAALVREGAG